MKGHLAHFHRKARPGQLSRRELIRRASITGLSVAAATPSLSRVADAATTENKGAQASPTGAVTISLLDRSTSPKYDSYAKWLVDTFNHQHQGSIHVALNMIPDADYHQKVSLVLKGDNPPDVFFSWEGGWAKFMVDSGFSAPLDEYYQKYQWPHKLNAAALQLATFGGHQWFVPFYMAASVVWYNIDLFQKYNLEVPKTWPQLTHVAEVLKSHGVAPFLLADQLQWEAQFLWTAYFVNKYGVQAYEDLLAHKIAWTDPRVVDTFAEMKRMATKGWFLNGINSMDFDSTAIIFWKRQQAAMWYQGSFILAKFLSPDDKLLYPVDWFPFPQIGSMEASIEMFAENTWMINKKSAHKAQAAELLDFLISREAQARMVDEVGPFPANRFVTLTSLPPMVQRLGSTIAEHHGYTWMHVDHALGPAIAHPFLVELQGVLAGTVTPEAAAKRTEEAAKATGAGGQ